MKIKRFLKGKSALWIGATVVAIAVISAVTIASGGGLLVVGLTIGCGIAGLGLVAYGVNDMIKSFKSKKHPAPVIIRQEMPVSDLRPFNNLKEEELGRTHVITNEPAYRSPLLNRKVGEKAEKEIEEEKKKFNPMRRSSASNIADTNPKNRKT